MIQEQILQCGADQIDEILRALITRHAELYPDWELVVFSIDKRGNRNEQIDQALQLLKKI